MATAVHHHVEHRAGSDAVLKDKAEAIPDIIEERRKDAEGRITINKYFTGKLLGKGGFAKCYLGTLVSTNQHYALKIVSKSTLVKIKSKQKLQTEIKIHRTLRHMYVVKFERYFEDHSNVYMVLELCSNNSMSELIKRRKRLTEPEVRYYLIQLISSMKYLHENLVIHRDLKLGNLFIDSEMKIKVGDFGLATKLTDASERRKTFCGTPNYIAPEIVQGKDGHSFEVDIWSIGVIMYTLLVGRPPFESKDVESTYKRILANSFSFPDQQPSVCEHAKSLIRNILQTKPSSRPKLDGIMEHSFFSRGGAYTPSTLLESSLRESPPAYQSSASVPIYGDENDPHFINKKVAPSVLIKQKSFLPDQKEPARARMIATSSGHQRTSDDPVKGETVKIINKNGLSSSAYNNGIGTLPGVSPKGNLGSGSGPGSQQIPGQGPGSQAFVAFAPPQKRERLTERLTAPVQVSSVHTQADKRTYSNKFDIYQDSKIQIQNENPAHNTKQNIPKEKEIIITNKLNQNQIYNHEKPKDPLIIPSKGVGAHRTYEHGTNTRAAMSSSSNHTSNPSTSNTNTNTNPSAVNNHTHTHTTSGNRGDNNNNHGEMDLLQTELEWFRLGSNSNSNSGNATTAATTGSDPSIARHKPFQSQSDVHVHPHRRTPEAWSEDDHNVLHHFAPPATTATAATAAHLAFSSPPTSAAATAAVISNNRSDQVHDRLLLPNNDSEPMQLSPPTDQIMASNEYKALGTLETMHEVLASQCLDELPLQGKQAFEASGLNRKIFHRPITRSSHHKANIWVVRYVDYTSKYGLGFLLNTGSAGVYFNDSTKIVISPDGLVFQYSERRRKEKGSSALEHTIQTHLISQYPAELQKKVTLLRHFRNYLVDQQREGASREDDGSATGGRSNLESIAIVAVEGASMGANHSIPFGKSSTILKSSDAILMGCCPSTVPGDTDANPNMPFLKKWVRTRHAILFRLSNKTVQVLFYDRSEVLLSSEARMVTYVSKQNVRSEHTLEEVLQTGRTDIAKRLKYAKDIMYRLISTQAS